MGPMGMNGTMGVGLPGTEAPVNGRAWQTSGSSSSGNSRVAVIVAAAALAVAAAVGL